MFLVISGCQTLPQQDWQVIAVSDTNCCQIRNVNTQVADGKLLISGIVQRSAISGAKPKGQVQIVIQSPGQTEPTIATINNLQPLSKRHSKRVERARFKAQFNGVPAAGSQITVRYNSVNAHQSVTLFNLP